MEIIQEIGSYAGFAAVVGLAVLSALYFSQARDVKRLREWAGRAPERTGPPVQQPRGVVAQPSPRPGTPVPPGTPARPVPRPPGAQPGAARAAAAGAGPAVARGPAPTTPAAGAASGREAGDADRPDATSLDTVVHPPPEPPATDSEAPAGDTGYTGERPADTGEPPADTGERPADTGDWDADDRADDTGEWDRGETGEWDADDRTDDTGDWDAREGDTGDWDPETGEWRPEDEHSGIDADRRSRPVAPATAAASAPRPPQPPQPFPRRATPASAGATAARDQRSGILPPYADTRREQGPPAASDGAGRRPLLLAIAGMVALAVVVFGALQLFGGSDGTDGGLAIEQQPTAGGGNGGSGAAATVDPGDISVSVLNGTTFPGLAATIGTTVREEGFRLVNVTNSSDQERAESVVLYAEGAEDEAAQVGRALDIGQREPIDPDSQSRAGDASVVVVAGADQAQ